MTKQIHAVTVSFLPRTVTVEVVYYYCYTIITAYSLTLEDEAFTQDITILIESTQVR